MTTVRSFGWTRPWSSSGRYVWPAALMVGSVSVGVATVKQPLVALGLAALAILFLMPWRILLFLFVASAIVTEWKLGIGQSGETSIPLAALILPVLSVRALLAAPRGRLPRWSWPEYLLIAFCVLQLVTSYLNSPNATPSFLVVAVLGLGILTYLAVYASLFSPDRLLFGARVVLITAFVGAVVGILSVVAHLAIGSSFGVDGYIVGAPASGFASEHDIFTSISASAALAFFILRRERSRLLPSKFLLMGFWVCLIGMLLGLARAGWVAFAVALLFYLLVLRPRKKPRSHILATGARAGLAVGAAGLFLFANLGNLSPGERAPESDDFLGDSILYQGENLVNFGDTTGAARLDEWKISLTEVRESPLIGLGTNSFGQRHLEYTREGSKGAFIGNLYLRTLYDSGIIGLLLLLLFLWHMLHPTAALARSWADLVPVSKAFIGAYAVFAVAFAATDASLQIWPWIILGVVRATQAQTHDQHKAFGSPRFRGMRPVHARPS